MSDRAFLFKMSSGSNDNIINFNFDWYEHTDKTLTIWLIKT